MNILKTCWSVAVCLCMLWILAGTNAVRAQDGAVAGRVTGAEGDSLPGVNVVLLETTYGDATATDGTYRIQAVPAGAYRIQASSIGFATEIRQIEVMADETILVDFVLEPIAIESREIVVTTTRRTADARNIPASVSVLTADDLIVRNVLALDDALQYVPGVQLTGNEVNIRGSSGFSYNTGSRILLLVDGMPMLSPDAERIPFELIPIHQIERIEVLKGPGSALYGGGALGGIIHILTKTYPSKPETFVETYGGAYQPAHHAIWRRQWEASKKPRPLGGIAINHARPLSSNTGLWTSLTYRYDASHLNMNSSRSLQGFSKFTWRTSPDSHVNILAGVNRKTSDTFIYWNGARDALNPGSTNLGSSISSSGTTDNRTQHVSLMPAYTNALSTSILLQAKARLFGIFIQPLDDEKKPKPLSKGTIGFRYGGEVQLDYEPAPGRYIIAGISGDANFTNSSFTGDNAPRSQPEVAAFTQWEEEIGRIKITGGLRFDTYRIRQGETLHKLSPRTSATISIGSSWTARLAYGEGFRAPSVLERFVESSDHLPIVSNPDLKPEISRSYEIGIRGQPLFGGAPLFTIDAALFLSQYREIIEPKFTPEERAFRFTNFTRARIGGGELELRAHILPGRASLHAGYTYLDAQDLETKESLAFRSAHLLKTGATLTVGPIESGADLRLASAPERVDSDFARFIADAELSSPIQVMDVRIGSSWRRIRVTLHVRNALNYHYLSRPALLGAPRHALLQISTRM
ncbi:MAG: TonB-dependent receptor [Bacteroidetes bacterium SB0662_bin_6]|nr:TonB-dependent receptor [Bacteroidetes bacterium SB0668_bin_1]MYE03441.1 TonB-dependent receptor [Bacteroidetes bacterium SB0662_bin_6]